MRVVLDGGTSIELGDTEATPTIGITDYSRRVTDDYGVTTVVERAFSRRMSVKLALPFDGVSTLQQRLANLRASSALWVADEQIAWLSVRGFYKEFDLDHAVPPLSYCTLTVEGLAETATVADTGIDPAVAGTSTLLLLQPVTIVDANLVSSTVPENDAPEWSAQTAYPMGAQVIKAATHRIYESATAGNVGNDPAGASGLWIDIGPTNRWAIFDQALGTSTTAATSVAVTINASAIQAVALLDVTAANVRVQATGYDRTVAAGAGAITFLDLPAGITRVTVTVTGSAVAIGTLLVGKLVGLGTTEASPSAGITDFSRKVVDDFGDVTIVKRAWSKRMTAKALIRTDAVDVVANRIATVRAQPSLWIGQTGLDSLIVYGFFKDFSIEVGINVSKLSLSIEGLSKAAPIAPALPGSVAWPDVTDPTGTKPTDNADVTGDNTSKDTASVGGKPSAEIIATLGRIIPLEERFDPIESDVSALAQAKVGTDASLAALTRATVDQDAVLRQIERDAGRLDETLLRLLSESTRTRAVLRDAGIVVDPVTGIVRIYAVDQLSDRTSRAETAIDGVNATITTKASVNYVKEQIALAVLDPNQAAQLEPIIARLTSAEQTIDGLNAVVALKAEAVELTRVSGTVTTVRQDLDALAGTVSTKAEKTVVDALGIAVGSVEQTLSTLGNVSGIAVTIRQARAVADDAATATLRGLIGGDDADRRRIVAQSEIRQELYAKIVDGLTAEAVARTLLSVKIGDLDARSVQETTLRIAVDKVLGERIDSLSIVAGDQAAAIATLTQASIGAGIGIAGIQTTIRQQSRDGDQSAEALLGSLIAGDQAGRRQASQLTQIQTEFATTLIANEAASAVARQALLARMGVAEAAIVTTSKVLADTTQALTSRIEAAEAVFNDAGTGLATTRTRLIREETLRADGDRANAEALAIVGAQVNDPGTGLPATLAEVKRVDRASADRDTAIGQRVDQVSARLADPDSGLDAIAADIVQLAQASVSGDQANAELIAQVRARLDSVGGVSIEQKFAALVEATGRILGTVTVAIDSNGNVVGTQLVGSPDGRGSLNLINADLRLGTGRVIYNTGVVMQVQGIGFGRDGDLLEWFGPSMAINACTRANATSYKTTSGSEYMGGSLSAGTRTNAVRATMIAANADVTTGQFESAGRARTVTVSLLFSTNVSNTGTCPAGPVTPSVAVELYRGTSAAGVILSSRTIVGGYSCEPGRPNEPGSIVEQISGSFTYTDNSGGNTSSYYVRLINRTTNTTPDQQVLSLISVEE